MLHSWKRAQLRWRKQSYLKQRLQKSVWKECSDCSLCTDLAKGPSRLGVHSGGSFTRLGGPRRSLYLQKNNNNNNKLKNQNRSSWRKWFITSANVLLSLHHRPRCEKNPPSFELLPTLIELKKESTIITLLPASLRRHGEHEAMACLAHRAPPPHTQPPHTPVSKGPSILTFPSAPPWCPCKGTSRRWL